MRTKTKLMIGGIVAAIIILQVLLLTVGRGGSDDPSDQPAATPSPGATTTPQVTPEATGNVPKSLKIKDTNDPFKFAERFAEVAFSWDAVNYDYEDYVDSLTGAFTPHYEGWTKEKSNYQMGGTRLDWIPGHIDMLIPPGIDWLGLRNDEQIVVFKAKKVFEPELQKERRENDIPFVWPAGVISLTVDGELHMTWKANGKKQSSVSSKALTVAVECPPNNPCKVFGIEGKVLR